ncbi:MAG: thioredoxin [Clostridiaceae bacterium]|nr:thioredoxin [Clostridiaceae bacterium]
MAQVLSLENFAQEVLQNNSVVLVDFWAEWCGPCRSISPLIDQLEEQYAGKVLVAKVNVDDEPAVAEEYRVSSIPTVFIFKDGIVVERLVGAHPYSEYENTLSKYL